MPESKSGAKGKMILQKNWYESNSGSFERDEVIELVASKNGKKVILKSSISVKPLFKPSESSTTKKSISVDRLIKYIQRNS